MSRLVIKPSDLEAIGRHGEAIAFQQVVDDDERRQVCLPVLGKEVRQPDDRVFFAELAPQFVHTASWSFSTLPHPGHWRRSSRSSQR